MDTLRSLRCPLLLFFSSNYVYYLDNINIITKAKSFESLQRLHYTSYVRYLRTFLRTTKRIYDVRLYTCAIQYTQVRSMYLLYALYDCVASRRLVPNTRGLSLSISAEKFRFIVVCITRTRVRWLRNKIGGEYAEGFVVLSINPRRPSIAVHGGQVVAGNSIALLFQKHRVLDRVPTRIRVLGKCTAPRPYKFKNRIKTCVE